MPPPQAYPGDPRANAFRWAQDRLVASDTGVTWYGPDGPGSFDEGGLIPGELRGRLEPEFESMEAEAARDGRTSYRSSVLLRIALRVPGMNPDAVIATWARIEDALDPIGDDQADVAASANAAGISWVELVQPPSGTGDVLRGSVRLVVFVEA
jgi:hypothetical protein